MTAEVPRGRRIRGGFRRVRAVFHLYVLFDGLFSVGPCQWSPTWVTHGDLQGWGTPADKMFSQRQKAKARLLVCGFLCVLCNKQKHGMREVGGILGRNSFRGRFCSHLSRIRGFLTQQKPLGKHWAWRLRPHTKKRRAKKKGRVRRAKDLCSTHRLPLKYR